MTVRTLGQSFIAVKYDPTPMNSQLPPLQSI